MSCCNFVVFLVLLLKWNYVSATKEEASMTLWDTLTENDATTYGKQYERFATWHAEVSVDDSVEKVDVLGAQSQARKHYNWLKTQANSSTFNNAQLVATLWDPVSRKFYSSTIPQRSMKHLMTKEQQRSDSDYSEAPNWGHQAKQLRPAYALHAEDGAYYFFEYSQTTKFQPNTHYPKGPNNEMPAIGIFGRYKVWEPEEGYVAKPCSSKIPNLLNPGATRRPTCKEVASNLGVRSWHDPPENPKAPKRKQPHSTQIAKRQPAAVTAKGLDSPIGLSTLSGKSDADLYFNNLATFWIQPSDTAAVKTPSITSLITSATEATAKPRCSMHFEDPDEGIDSPFCVCRTHNQRKTLPLLTKQSIDEETDSCAYTSLPKSDYITPRIGFGPPTTNYHLCQVCTRAVVNGDSCNSIPGCLPQTAQAEILAGTSPVHVATLTGHKLYTAVSNALEELCPHVTQTTSSTKCDETTEIKLGDIPTLDSSTSSGLMEGELIITVDNGSYNISSIRSAMIQAVAASFEHAAKNKNCQNISYTQYDDHEPIQVHKTWCNTVQFAAVQYYNPWWRLQENPGASDNIYANIRYQHPPIIDNFWCFVLEAAADALSFLQPEFAVGDVSLGDVLDVLCTDDEP